MLRELAALAVLILVWGTTWAAIAVGLEGLPPWTGVAARFALAAAALHVVGRLAGVAPQRGARLYRVWWVETVFAFSLSYGVVYWAEQWVPSGLSAVLFSTFPLFVAVLAHLWLPAERLAWRHLAGVGLASVGVAVIFSDDLALGGDPRTLVAAAVFLVSPAAAAVSHVLVKKWGEGLHPLNIVKVPMALTGVLMGALALAFERHRAFVLDARSLGAVVYLALVGSALTFTVYYWLLERLPATRLALITYGIPIVAVAVGALALGETFTWRAAAGSALVLIGVGLALAGRRRPRPVT